MRKIIVLTLLISSSCVFAMNNGNGKGSGDNGSKKAAEAFGKIVSSFSFTDAYKINKELKKGSSSSYSSYQSSYKSNYNSNKKSGKSYPGKSSGCNIQ